MIENEIQRATRIYWALLVLTAATVGAYVVLALPRSLTILVAATIAWMKAGLIGYHYMELKQERPLVWSVVIISLAAVAILAFGVIPDLTGKVP